MRFLRFGRKLSGREIARSIGPGGLHATLLTIFTKDAENRFHRCGDRAMSVHDGRGTKPLPEKEISLEH